MSTYMVICIAGLFAIFSTTMAKSPVLPLYAAYLGVGPEGIGIIASISPIAGILCSIPAGILAGRYGSKKMLFVASCIFFTAPLLYLFAANVVYLSAVRFYHGLATAIFIPVAMSVISELHAGRKGELLGMFSSATLAGRFFAPIVGGTIIGLFAAKQHAGFNAVYALCCLSGLITLVFILKLPKDADTPKVPKRTDFINMLTELFSRRAILLTAAVEAAVLFSYGTFETFLPLYFLSRGLSPYKIGVVLSAQIISVALTKPLMGRFSDKYGRVNQIIAGLIFCALCAAAISFVNSFVSGLIVSILFGLCISVVTSATSALIADISSREQLSSSMGVFASVMDVGHTAGPLVSGVVAASFGLSKTFFVSSAVLVAALVMFSFYRRRLAAI
ncbi:MFS transporter [Candidatus Magnetomonas plexicatena]|uniref:MFS transporter n=1 Tax=Candidatus Magnetomonas plexicatena TaxID=2552947 RepID=UPI001C750BA1|nr:MFS transporter [Nitrospirales bacterium LBB_01]